MSTPPENNAIAPVQPEQRALRPVIFYLIVGIVFIADQASKAWIQKTMLWEETKPLLGNAFQLTLTRNTGGAWGLLPNGNPLFIVFAIIAVCALLFAYHRMPRIDLLVGAAFALALGGALGNLADRIRYHYVVDFFDVRIIRFPIFNIADSAITLGIVFLLIHFLRSPHQEEPGTLGATVALATDDSSNRSEQKF